MSFKGRPFLPSDMEWYESWYKARDHVEPPPPPKVSHVIEHADFGPVAAGGIVLTDSDYTFPEGFCTNPKAPASIRKEALFALGVWAFKTTVGLGYKRAITITQAPVIAELFESMVAHDIMGEGLPSVFTEFKAHKVYEVKHGK